MEENNIPGASAFVSKDTLHINFEGEEFATSIHDLTIKGRHNQYNSMAAGLSGRTANIRSEKIRESFESFEGLEHRLEYVATVRGVDFINDSKATNVNSTWYALESMQKPVVLILGGIDKGNKYQEIEEMVREKVKGIICLGKHNERIHDFFEGLVPDILDTKTAQDAVLAAYTLADAGDVVLLSPACASFDLFQNFEDRGRQFKQAVRNL